MINPEGLPILATQVTRRTAEGEHPRIRRCLNVATSPTALLLLSPALSPFLPRTPGQIPRRRMPEDGWRL